MGIYDRDYYRSPPPRGFHMGMWSVTTWLIILNVAVFLIAGLTRPRLSPNADPHQIEEQQPVGKFFRMSPIERLGFFSKETAIGRGQVWRFISFQFLHATPMHLFGNMLGLFFFGQMIETHLGSRRYVAFYLICGMAGAAAFLGMSALGILRVQPWMPLVGASAGVFGVLAAAAYIAPDREVVTMIGFFPVPMKLRTMAMVLLVIAAITVFTQGPNAGGEAAHLGGAALGILLMLNQHWLNPFAPRRRVAFRDWSRETDR